MTLVILLNTLLEKFIRVYSLSTAWAGAAVDEPISAIDGLIP